MSFLSFFPQKSVDRSWRNVYAVLTSDSLNVYKDKKTAAEQQVIIIHHIVMEVYVHIFACFPAPYNL